MPDIISEELFNLYRNKEPLRFRILEEMIKTGEIIINKGDDKNADKNL